MSEEPPRGLTAEQIRQRYAAGDTDWHAGWNTAVAALSSEADHGQPITPEDRIERLARELAERYSECAWDALSDFARGEWVKEARDIMEAVEAPVE